MAKDTQHFIRIQNPRSTRRSILENARDTLSILKGYEDFKVIRAERMSLANKFKGDMNEIRTLVLEFKNNLPKSSIREIKKPMIVAPTAQKPVRELKKIEQELSDIESKLNSI